VPRWLISAKGAKTHLPDQSIRTKQGLPRVAATASPHCLKILTQNIDTGSAGGRLIFMVFSVIAKFEREIIHERMCAGLDAARARGRTGDDHARFQKRT